MNKTILIGYLGQDPEIRYTADGLPVANVNLATSIKIKGKDYTEWHRLIFFRKTAEIVGQYLVKGSQIAVEGRLQTRKWQDKDGNDRWTTELVVSSLEMLGGKRKEETDRPPTPPPTDPPSSNDDVPF